MNDNQGLLTSRSVFWIRHILTIVWFKIIGLYEAVRGLTYLSGRISAALSRFRKVAVSEGYEAV